MNGFMAPGPFKSQSATISVVDQSFNGNFTGTGNYAGYLDVSISVVTNINNYKWYVSIANAHTGQADVGSSWSFSGRSNTVIRINANNISAIDAINGTIHFISISYT